MHNSGIGCSTFGMTGCTAFLNNCAGLIASRTTEIYTRSCGSIIFLTNIIMATIEFHMNLRRSASMADGTGRCVWRNPVVIRGIKGIGTAINAGAQNTTVNLNRVKTIIGVTGNTIAYPLWITNIIYRMYSMNKRFKVHGAQAG
jgi:hypothetical protein